MTTYNYPEIVDYFGRLIKLDWAEDTSYNSINLPNRNNTAVLMTSTDATDPNLRHITKVLAKPNQLVMGDGSGYTPILKKLYGTSAYNQTEVSIPNFEPKAGMQLLFDCAYNVTDSKTPVGPLANGPHYLMLLATVQSVDNTNWIQLSIPEGKLQNTIELNDTTETIDMTIYGDFITSNSNRYEYSTGNFTVSLNLGASGILLKSVYKFYMRDSSVVRLPDEEIELGSTKCYIKNVYLIA